MNEKLISSTKTRRMFFSGYYVDNQGYVIIVSHIKFSVVSAMGNMI